MYTIKLYRSWYLFLSSACRVQAFATSLAIASSASFLPFLPAVFSAASMAYNMPPAASDPKASPVLSTSGNFHAPVIVLNATLACLSSHKYWLSGLCLIY